MSNRKPSLVGVIGHPVGHSKSPIIHGYWLQHHDVNGHYIPMEVTRSNFAEVIGILPKMGFRGVNVTIPHKEDALRHHDFITDQAVLIGAVNTLTFGPDGRIHADNTDSYGFLRNLKEQIPDWKADSGPALVIGAGGGARAAIYSLINEGAPAVHVVNRSKGRAEELRRVFGNRVSVERKSDVPDLLREVSLVANATPLGMKGMPRLNFPHRALRPGTVVTDLVYAPLETELLKQAAARKCRVADGLGMLLHQAAASFDAWYGIKPRINPTLRSLTLAG